MREIFIRRSVRKFLLDEVDMCKVEQMIDAAMQAPSAMGQKPWHFVIVSDKEIISKLSNAYIGARALKEANKVVVFVIDKLVPNFEFVEAEMGAAIQNFMLMGVMFGIGTVWSGTYPREERTDLIDKIINLEKNYQSFAIVGVGYPKDSNAFHDVRRFDKERIHHNKW